AGPQVLGRSLPPAAAFSARQDACQPPTRPEEIGSFSFESTAFESAALEVAEVVFCSRDDSRAQHPFERHAEIGAHPPRIDPVAGTDCTIPEDRSRPNYFMQVFRFKDEAEFTAFDDKFHKDRKIAAIYALLDDIVEAEKSDFKIFERRL